VEAMPEDAAMVGRYGRGHADGVAVAKPGC